MSRRYSTARQVSKPPTICYWVDQQLSSNVHLFPTMFRVFSYRLPETEEKGNVKKESRKGFWYSNSQLRKFSMGSKILANDPHNVVLQPILKISISLVNPALKDEVCINI